MIQLHDVLTRAERLDQMQQSLLRFPFMEPERSFHDGIMSIVGYGPSLADTWQDIQRPMIATSGAYDYLRERGIIAEYYAAMDPRPEVAQLLKNPAHETEFLMASVCHPGFWDLLHGFNVKLWHLASGDDRTILRWIREHHPAGMQCLIAGGSTIGQRAMNVAAALGYRRFRFYGVDCSYTDKRHAGEHALEKEIPILVECGAQKFTTTMQLYEAAAQLTKDIDELDIETEFYGEGLMQTLARIIQQRKKDV